MKVCPTPTHPALLGAPGMSLSPRAQASCLPDPATVMVLLLRSALRVTRRTVNSRYMVWTVRSISSPVSLERLDPQAGSVAVADSIPASSVVLRGGVSRGGDAGDDPPLGSLERPAPGNPVTLGRRQLQEGM